MSTPGKWKVGDVVVTSAGNHWTVLAVYPSDYDIMRIRTGPRWSETSTGARLGRTARSSDIISQRLDPDFEWTDEEREMVVREMVRRATA